MAYHIATLTTPCIRLVAIDLLVHAPPLCLQELFRGCQLPLVSHAANRPRRVWRRQLKAPGRQVGQRKVRRVGKVPCAIQLCCPQVQDDSITARGMCC